MPKSVPFESVPIFPHISPACNTFENPDLVKPVEWNEATLAENRLQVTPPAKSVAVLELK
jgi:alpha-L-arabinofuranosidase